MVCRGAVARAFAVVRPPGHHAECARAMGFCFYNNVAVAALAARQEPGIERVLVLDWDVHHGTSGVAASLHSPVLAMICLDCSLRGSSTLSWSWTGMCTAVRPAQSHRCTHRF